MHWICGIITRAGSGADSATRQHTQMGADGRASCAPWGVVVSSKTSPLSTSLSPADGDGLQTKGKARAFERRARNGINTTDCWPCLRPEIYLSIYLAFIQIPAFCGTKAPRLGPLSL